MESGEALIFQNGVQLETVPASLAFDNSAFKWGSSVFTTALVEDGVMPFFEDHLERLCRGSEWLWEERFSKSYFKEIFQNLGHLNLLDSYILRLTLFKDSQGEMINLLMIKRLASFSSGIHLQTRVLDHPMKNRPVDIKIGCYADRMRSIGEGSDEPLFIDEFGNYLEASYFNVVFKDKNGDLKSPLIQSGALLGIGITKGLEGSGIKFTTINKNEAREMDSIFLVNNVRGPMEAISLDGKGLRSDYSELSKLRELFDLNKTNSGCRLWQTKK